MHARKLHLISEAASCSGCQAEPFCLQSVFNQEQLREFRQAIRVRGPIQRGETVYRMGQPFHSIYFIRSGSVKTELCTVHGAQEVTAFYLVGEILGVDAIGCDHYPSDAVAMEETWLCELPFSQIQSISHRCNNFQQELLMRLGRTLNSDIYQWALARNLKVKQKVAWFLFDLFKRLHSRQTRDLRTIPLPMRKTDIANYLGLAPESLSRGLLALEKEGIILNRTKQIELCDLQRVQALSVI